MRLLVTIALVAAFHPLHACINDSATEVDEQQFTSGYQNDRQGPRNAVGIRVATFNPAALALLVPSILLIGVAALWLRQQRQSQERRTQTNRAQQEA
jgi:hypothetical protein